VEHSTGYIRGTVEPSSMNMVVFMSRQTAGLMVVGGGEVTGDRAGRAVEPAIAGELHRARGGIGLQRGKVLIQPFQSSGMDEDVAQLGTRAG
jgi:hypothetical protein